MKNIVLLQRLPKPISIVEEVASLGPYYHSSIVLAPPDRGVIKMNVDVAFPTGKNFYVTAMVARGCSSECLWWKILKKLGRPPVSSGKTTGMLHALQLAKEKGCNAIVIEGDSLQVMTALTEEECPLAPFGAIVEQCLVYARGFNLVSFQFIKRTGNHLAHELAKLYEMTGLKGFILPPGLVMNI
ncbi:PREDICTED: uncharacterized protein LOC105972737 [Erythranthe guttata]|uniref:uncharacterized protein LOC105972737 n=1 Tax=Erythranthe guttata TaxID=4155 RepID=UPI00064DF305|nr:PREDICTED: uncharacterized protein LOC105972737 [Erythranthe guttata]|eukprot:XP_012853169.1 PREDICTED: uncharacterized protein LOC105972737 [Erythranthe guttata]